MSSLVYYCPLCVNKKTYYYKYIDDGNKIECLICHSIVKLIRQKYIPREK